MKQAAALLLASLPAATVSAGLYAQTRVDSSLSTWKAPRGQTCILYPALLPVSQAFDSGALTAALRNEWGSIRPRRGFVLFSVTSDTTGTVENRVLETTLPASATEKFGQIVTHHLKPGQPFSGRVRVDGRDPIRVRTGHTEECPPSYWNREEIDAFIHSPDWRERLQRAGVHRPTEVMAEFIIDTMGLAERRMTFTPSFGPTIDSLTETLVHLMRFHPGTVERRPVRVLVRQRVFLIP